MYCESTRALLLLKNDKIIPGIKSRSAGGGHNERNAINFTAEENEEVERNLRVYYQQYTHQKERTYVLVCLCVGKTKKRELKEKERFSIRIVLFL